MSVGLQRLREEPDVIRDGALDKGEDASLVDAALALDARRRRLLGEADALKAERNSASKRVGEAIRAGAAPDGPEVAALRASSVTAGERIAVLDAEVAQVEAELEDVLLRIPNPADPDVPVGDADANVVVRTWGELAAARRAPAAPLAGEAGRGGRSGGRLHLGAAGRTGISPRRSASSTSSAAPRSPAPASRSTGGRAPRSSAP